MDDLIFDPLTGLPVNEETQTITEEPVESVDVVPGDSDDEPVEITIVEDGDDDGDDEDDTDDADASMPRCR